MLMLTFISPSNYSRARRYYVKLFFASLMHLSTFVFLTMYGAMSDEHLDAPPVPWMHGAAGIMGGAISMTMFYPLDLLRTRAHTHDKSGMHLRSARELYRQEGVKAFYRGVTMAVCAHSVGWGTYLTLFRTAQNRLRDANHGRDSVPGDFLAACIAATLTATLVTPLNLVKTRVQLHDEKSKPKGVIGSLRAVVREEGVSRLFRGVGPQILLSSHTTIQVAMYEFMKRKLWSEDAEPPMLGVALASGASKAVAAVVCNPLEVCRTRLQDKKNTKAIDYSSMNTAFLTIWRDEGIRGLYRGIAVNLCRVVPTTVVAFVLYEKCLVAIRYLHR